MRLRHIRILPPPPSLPQNPAKVQLNLSVNHLLCFCFSFCCHASTPPTIKNLDASEPLVPVPVTLFPQLSNPAAIPKVSFIQKLPGPNKELHLFNLLEQISKR